MKIGTITFHGSHNHGSMLQAYALQTFVLELARERDVPCEYEIINYRSTFQKDLYAAPKFNSRRNAVKRLMYLPYKKAMDESYNRFEAFLREYLNVTEEFAETDQLTEKCWKYDALLAGSDQIWNIRTRDFSFAYLLEGCPQKKVSYAASLGPLDIEWEKYDLDRYRKGIEKFSAISVREEKSRQMLKRVAPERDAEILCDPTLLLTRDQWRKVQSDMNYNDGKYILFYCLEPTRGHMRLAKMLSMKTGLPVVSTGYRCRSDYFNPFVKLYNAGPRDFLSLVDHAQMVLTSSFHGTAFSMIYGKPFYSVNGMADGRIAHILKQAHAEGNSVSLNDEQFKSDAMAIDASDYIQQEAMKAMVYFSKNLFS